LKNVKNVEKIPKYKVLNKLCEVITKMKVDVPVFAQAPDSPTSRNSFTDNREKNSMVESREIIAEQMREMNDLDNFFSKKLTMKEIDNYLS
jgi:hypothetical protein